MRVRRLLTSTLRWTGRISLVVLTLFLGLLAYLLVSSLLLETNTEGNTPHPVKW